MTYDLTHARHDLMTCLAPGLFRSLKTGERKKTKLDVTYRYSENEEARFVGFEPLGADDMRILQGLVALAGPNGIILEEDDERDRAKQLRLLLEPKFDAAEADALVVKESMTKLMKEIGLAHSGNNIKTLKASLTRMSNVTVVITNGPRVASFHLLSYAFDEDSGKLYVALNPRLTDAILGNSKHARIELNEVRTMSGDTTRLIHQRLCGWIWPGSSGRIELDTLCSYVWPDEATPNNMRQRRKRVRDSLAELEALGWTVKEYAKAKYDIVRPALN